MACASKTFRVSRSVWGDGTTTPVYHSFLRLPVSDWAKARFTLMVEGTSGNLTVSSAVMYGEKEADFATGTGTDFPTPATTLTADGSAYGTLYGNFDLGQQLVDIGVRAKNTTANAKIEQARVTLLVDVSE